MPQRPSVEPPTALLATGVNLANDVATGQLVAALERAGVPSVVLKGPSLREWLYEPDEARLSVDIDLLLAEGDLAAGAGVLAEHGYAHLGPDAVGRDRPSCDVWESRDRAVLVELHVTLAGVGVAPDDAWAVLSSRTEPMTVGGIRVPVLAVPARAMHVALHAAQHGARHAKTLADLERAIDRGPAGAWEEAAALARRLDAVPAFAAGLGLLPAGRALLARLGVQPGGSVTAVLRATSPPPMAEGLEWLATLPGRRARAAFVARHLAPHPGYMRMWLPLARRGRLGLAVAYAWRPVWLALHAGPALLAWRSARRRAAR